mgnify:CR=1 FL=1
MKPKTRIQKEIARLAGQLRPITESQRRYAIEHCFKPFGRRTKKTVTCSRCGHVWKAEHTLADSVCGCTCPHCGKTLDVVDTLRRVFKQMEYFSVVTTCKGYQVIRFFSVKAEFRMGQPAKYDFTEVVQRWIAPNGKHETVARLRCMSMLYYDMWNEYSPLELRQKNDRTYIYDIVPMCTYPIVKVIPELKRNGFKGEYHSIQPFDLFKAILSDSRNETLLKSGQYALLRHAIRNNRNLASYWASVKICIRHGYTIPDGSMWCDHIDLLRHFGKDLNSPKYVCPQDLKAEHEKLTAKRNRQREQEEIAEKKRKAMEDEAKFKELKGKFFGIAFTDGTLQVRVLESVHDHLVEGTLMRHCVFSNAYYLKENSLILSATIGGKRIETVEVNLQTLKVVQSRAVCNGISEYHNRIINLVENNANLFRQRMKAA